MPGDEEDSVDELAGDIFGDFDLYSRFRERADANATFSILAKVMSMMLVRDRGDKARFAPLVEYAGGYTSFTTAQLVPEDIELLRGVQSTNPAIRARVNDVLWECTSGKQRVDHVHRAVDAYLELAEKVEWHDADDLLHRALELASRFQGSDSGERKERIHNFARAVLDTGASSPGQLLDLCELLRVSTTGAADQGAVLEALRAARKDAASARSFGLERNLIIEMQSWLDDDELIQDLSRDAAMLWVGEAEARLEGEGRSAFVAASFLEKAVHKLRAIPRKHRLRLNVEEQIASLRAQMRTLGEEAVDEMQAFESESVSLDVLATNARAAVAGRTATDALMRLARVATLSTEVADRQTAEEVLEGSFARLFPTTSLTRDGRVADKSGEYEAVDRQMGELAHQRRMMVTMGQILPALRTMRAEHSLGRGEFAALAYASAVVPPGQEQLFASGLYAGWNLDTDAAVHILVPRMEALVRHHLKSAGVITTHLEGGGIEDEISLPALLDKPEAAGVFGADLIYELRGVYAGRFGSNLRHEVAHGFVTDSNRGSVLGIYAWWLTLRMVTVPFWNQAVADNDDEAAAEPGQPDAS